MTAIAIKLESTDPRRPSLDLSWDRHAGTLTGVGAASFVRAAVPHAWHAVHPLPDAVRLSAEPLKDPTSVAVLLGLNYRLPPALARHYPDTPDALNEFSPEIRNQVCF